MAEREREVRRFHAFSAAERDAILAGLRLLQRAHILPLEIMDIATNGEEHLVLDDDAIDALCERINA